MESTRKLFEGNIRTKNIRNQADMSYGASKLKVYDQALL